MFVLPSYREGVPRSTQEAAALGRAQAPVMDAALTIPLSIRYEVDALSTRVQGYSANLLGKPKFLHVGLG